MVGFDPGPILAPERSLREIEPGLYSALAADDEGAPYDSRAAGYDRMVSWGAYSRLAWGVDPEVYTEFIDRALGSRREGPVLDVAAGSCVHSAECYVRCDRPVVVLDRSLAMLRRGRQRVVALTGSLPENVIFLQADAGALPLRAGSVSTVLCHGAFHVFTEPDSICREWQRVLADGGSLFVSSLIRGRWLGDGYLWLLHRAGEVAPPRSAHALVEALAAHFGRDFDLRAIGNFGFVGYDSRSTST